jgi:predicted nucleotidyltransferase
MPRQFLNSVVIKSVDVARVRQCADEYAKRLLTENGDVEEVVIFGSFANDTYAPGSDLDVFIVLSRATEPVRERIATFRPTNFPVPVDVFPLTRAEMEELSASPLLAAVKKSRWRYSR